MRCVSVHFSLCQQQTITENAMRKTGAITIIQQILEKHPIYQQKAHIESHTNVHNFKYFWVLQKKDLSLIYAIQIDYVLSLSPLDSQTL